MKGCDNLRSANKSLKSTKQYSQYEDRKGAISPIRTEPDLSASNGSNIKCNNSSDVGDTIGPMKRIKFRTLNRRQKLILVLCCATFFLEGVAFSIIAPFFPTKALSKGMSLVLTGFVFSGFQLVTFITSPIFAANIRHLRPKFIVLSGTFVAGSCTIIFGLLDMCPPGAPFITLAFTCRTLEAIGYTSYYIGLMSFITTEFPSDIATSLSIMQSINGIGMMVGPVLGGALYELGGYELPFFIIGSLVISNMAPFWFLIPDITPAPKLEKHSSQFSMLHCVTLVIILIAITISSSARYFLNPILSPYLKTFDLNEGLIGFIFAVPMLLYTCFCPLWGYLIDRKHMTFHLIVIGHFFYGIGYLIMGPSDVLPFLPSSYWTMILGLALTGMCFGCTLLSSFKALQIAAVSVGFEKDSLETLSMITGLLSTGYSLGAFVSTTAAGAMADYLGFTNAFAAIGIANLGMCLVLLVYFTYKRKDLNEYIVQI